MENEDKHRRGKSIYSDFLEEWCRRTGKDISKVVAKNCGDVSELSGQSLDAIWFDEAAEYNREAFERLQRKAAETGCVFFIIQPGEGDNKKDLLSLWGGMEIQEVDIHNGEGDCEG